MNGNVKDLLTQLQQVAPHISRLHSLGEIERGLWPAIDAITRFLDAGTSGNIHIKINKGMIGEVRTQVSEYTLATTSRKDSFDE